MGQDVSKIGDGSSVPLADLQAIYSSTLKAFQVALKGSYVTEGVTYNPPNVCDLLAVVYKVGDAIYRTSRITPAGPELGPAQTSFDDGPLRSPFGPGKNW